jgi:hypothetical protein
MEKDLIINFRLFKSDGTLLGVVEHSKQLPHQWLHPKANRVGGKRSMKNVIISDFRMIFTTPDTTVSWINSRKITKTSDWDSMSVGDTFWIKTGEKLEVFTPQNCTKISDWTGVFQGCLNRVTCAARFLELSGDVQENFFNTLTVNDRIKLLRVSNSYNKQFNNVKFGLQQLIKYCEHVASTKSRRAQEKALKNTEEEKLYAREMRIMRAASRDFREPDIGGCVDFDTTMTHEIRPDNEISYHSIFFPEIQTANDRLQRQVKLPVSIATTFYWNGCILFSINKNVFYRFNYKLGLRTVIS